MGLEKIEIWVHDHILKNATIRHGIYGAYQRVLWLVAPKIKVEGNVKKLTPDDGFEYFFGYYDKCPFNSDQTKLLALKVNSTTKVADSTEEAKIVVIESGHCKEVASTHSWNVQQSCMLQWLDDDNILFNDYRENKYISVILNLNSGEEKIIDFPVYTVSSDKSYALSLDFSRLHRLRPGYGYANMEEETKSEKCPNKTCIWKVDLQTGKVSPLLNYADFAKFEPRKEMEGAEHKVNHLMISPNGKRFMVLHRWFQGETKYTRLVTCNVDGTDMYNLSDDDFVSHCCWKNNQEIVSYLNKKDGGKGYYIMKDKTHDYKKIWDELVMDGHPSFNGKQYVTDTYPNRTRIQSVYVMDGDKVIRIARMFSPFKYGGDVRCDLHPRWSRDGKSVIVDASFDGKRGVYQIEV